jgi:hypothetical protein
MELNAGNGIVGVRLSEFVMTRLASKASTSGRGLLTFIQSFELSFSVRAISSQPAHPRQGAPDRGRRERRHQQEEELEGRAWRTSML